MGLGGVIASLQLPLVCDFLLPLPFASDEAAKSSRPPTADGGRGQVKHHSFCQWHKIVFLPTFQRLSRQLSTWGRHRRTPLAHEAESALQLHFTTPS